MTKRLKHFWAGMICVFLLAATVAGADPTTTGGGGLKPHVPSGVSTVRPTL